MTARIYGIRACRGALAPGGALWVDAASANRRIWHLAAEAKAAGVQVHKTTKRRLDAACGSGNHQGVVFMSAPQPEAAAGLPQVIAKTDKAAIALDGVSDPQNLGAIVRTAAAFGIGAIVMPRAGSAPMNAAAAKIAGGYASRVAICRVGNLRRALKTMTDGGWRTVAVDESGERSFFDVPLPPPPLCWVFGGEGKGLRPIVRGACAFSARLPSVDGDAGCLNVAAAVAGCLTAAQIGLRRRA
ncbi:MAG: TrmH family RNA methyltransferase [Gammaproteobacteria bacterium]